jgi:hypothetical protein
MVLQLEVIRQPAHQGLVANKIRTWKGYSRREVSYIRQGFQSKNGLELMDCLLILGRDQGVKPINNGIDTRNAVLRTKLLNWVVPGSITFLLVT